MPLEFPFTTKDMVLGGIVPAAVVVAGSLLSFRFANREFSRSIAVNWAVAVAFFLGIRLLALTPWKPSTHWHWLPYIGLACAILSPLTVHRNIVARIAGAGIMAVLSACLLVPDWNDLPQSRLVMISSFAVALVVVQAGVSSLTMRVERRGLAIVLAGSALGAAVILTLAGSLRFGQIGGCIAAAFFGLMVALFIDRKCDKMPDLSILFTMLCCGAMLVGKLNLSSDVPLISFLIPPLAPTSIWLGRTRPLAKFTASSRILTDIMLPTIIVLTGIGIAANAVFNPVIH